VVSLLASVFCFGSAAQAEEITSDNWGEKVGFKPDLSVVKVKKGTKITKKNVDQVAEIIPPGMKKMIEKYKLALKVKDYEPIHPSEGYIEATNKYLGKTKLVNIGKEFRKRGVSGYVAGLPFPQPKNGTQVAWNYHYSYQGDDSDTYYTVYWISASAGVEHTEDWRWAFIMRTINRTDVEPLPAIQTFLDKGVQYTSITYALAPYDKKGFGALFTRSVQPLDQQGHIYVPAMRRVLRNTFGTRGDTWNSTDLLYEDVKGYLGYPEWMNWKIVGKKTMLMPMRAGCKVGKNTAEKNFELKKWPHWNPKMKYEPRPMYVLEVTPKFPDYPYSKMHIYVDAETFLIPYKDAYDKKGDLWKVVMNGYNASEDMDLLPSPAGCATVVDFQAEHATLFNFSKITFNTDLDHKIFTLSSLRKRGR
jgi:hypothetical protein